MSAEKLPDDPLQTPLQRRALAWHEIAGRLHDVFATDTAELVVTLNALSVVLGAGVVWLEFQPSWWTLLAGMAVTNVALFLMLLRADTATAGGILAGVISACAVGGFAAALSVRLNVVAAGGLGVCVAVATFVFTVRTYRRFSRALRKLREPSAQGQA